MDDGSTYIPKNGKTCFTCEISTHVSQEDAIKLIELFKTK
jgi:hypothetical protein